MSNKSEAEIEQERDNVSSDDDSSEHDDAIPVAVPREAEKPELRQMRKPHIPAKIDLCGCQPNLFQAELTTNTFPCETDNKPLHKNTVESFTWAITQHPQQLSS
ncbi:hypothetical protein PAMP_006770 [Pampus punctatissimus]